MTTLLVLYRRPDGGPEETATFERRYTQEHLPLVATTPGLRSAVIQRVSGALGGETDLVLVAAMTFDDRACPRCRAGVRRDARGGPQPARDRPGSGHVPGGRGRPRDDRSRFRRCGYCPYTERRSRVSDAPTPLDTATPVSVRFPARPGVALVTIDRQRALNALSFDLLDALADALAALDADPACRAIVITGAGSRAFAAGADIRELATQTSASLREGRRFEVWDRIAAVGLPLIAAVRGFAFGGGCELAMTCDLIIAADDATFGQPEIRLGVMPGAGGRSGSRAPSASRVPWT